MALLKPVPIDVLDIKMNATLRTCESIEIHLVYLGPKLIEDKELVQFQRFHKVHYHISLNKFTLTIQIYYHRVLYAGNLRIQNFIILWNLLICLIMMLIFLIMKTRNLLI